jgi:hypothetical protein
MDVQQITGRVGQALDEQLTSLDGVISVEWWTESFGRIGFVSVKVMNDDKAVHSFNISIRPHGG